VSLALAACNGTAAPPAAPVDERLQQQVQAGQASYSSERGDEAAERYRQALRRAQARDDLTAIGDLGYDLAVAELRANAPDRALADARATREELERRGTPPFPALLLAEAAALYRLGSPAAAEVLATRARAGADAETAARASFLLGLIADERDDQAGLAAAAAALDSATAPPLQADAAELSARLALRHGDWRQARSEAERAVALRQDVLDYRGLARALALSGKAARLAGDNTAAADLYLRAGRSAAVQGDQTAARNWLRQAAALAPGQPVGQAANDLLRKLEQSELLQ
jgi:hypothetical protein